MSQSADTLLYQAAFFSESAILTTSDSVSLDKTIKTSSILSETKNQNTPFQKYLRPPSEGVNPFWILMGSLVIFAFLNLFFYKYNKYKIFGFFYSKYKSLNLEKEYRNNLLSRILSLVFFFNITLFLQLLSQGFNFIIPTINGLSGYWLIFLFILAFSLLKTIFVILSSILFSTYDQGLLLLKINNEAQWVVTIVLIPLNFLLLYATNSNWMIFLIIAILVIIFTIKLYKLYLKIHKTTYYYNYQIILYLCSLEIIPLLVLFRYLIT